jgi:8-amino-7-oxononanoate synthase
MLAQRLFNRGLNVLPIIYPVVEEGAARLRFFLSASHNESDVRFAIRTVAEELNPAQKELADFNGKSETSPSGCKNE